MNEEIKKLIEEEAERKYLILDDDDFLDFSDEEKLKAFKAGASFILSKWQEANRWRKFATDNLPTIGQQIVCRGSEGNCHLAKPISHDGIHLLAEIFTEWKPIE